MNLAHHTIVSSSKATHCCFLGSKAKNFAAWPSEEVFFWWKSFGTPYYPGLETSLQMQGARVQKICLELQILDSCVGNCLAKGLFRELITSQWSLTLIIVNRIVVKMRVFTKQRACPGNDLQPFLFCKNLNFSQFITTFLFLTLGFESQPYTIEIVYPRPSGFAIYYLSTSII